MSYILDALRRAEADRQRGAVPGLHTPGTTPAGMASPAARDRSPLLLAVGAALGVAVLAALAVLALGGHRATDAPPPPAAAAPLPAPLPAAAPPVAVVATAPPAAPVVVVMPAPIAAPVAAPDTALGGAPNTARVAAQVAPPAPAPVAPLAAGTAPAQRVPRLAELPEALRRQVPALALGGGMYSEQPAQRLVIVNGQVAREGDEAAPGVRVIQIQPKAVVFAVGGQRFELPL